MKLTNDSAGNLSIVDQIRNGMLQKALEKFDWLISADKKYGSEEYKSR